MTTAPPSFDVKEFEEKYGRFVLFCAQQEEHLGGLLQSHLSPQIFALLMYRAAEQLYPHYITVLEATEYGVPDPENPAVLREPTNEEVEMRSVQLSMMLCKQAQQFFSDPRTAAGIARLLQYFLEFYELLCQETITSMRRAPAAQKSQRPHPHPHPHPSSAGSVAQQSSTTTTPAAAATTASSAPPSSACGDAREADWAEKETVLRQALQQLSTTPQ